MELNDREKALVKDCLILVAKSPNVAAEQMEELVTLSKKFAVEVKPEEKDV